MNQMRWDEGVSHLGSDVIDFFTHLLGQSSRSVLYIAGAGFDPRATHLAVRISTTPANRKGIFIREERPDPAQALVDRAEANEQVLLNAYPNHERLRIDVFDHEHAVVGGNEAVKRFRELLGARGALDEFTDIIVDVSALSLGIGFPIVGLLYDLLKERTRPNLHIVAATGGPETEAAIIAELAEDFQNPFGFKGQRATGEAVRLWIPQLTRTRQHAFATLFQELQPKETCPIFPFPAKDARSVEALLDTYAADLTEDWLVDTRHMLLAAEDDPLDLYRTISKIHLARQDVYRLADQPAETVLSPLGSKAMAIGALLAALEHELQVAYVETRRFELPPGGFSDTVDEPRFVHVWVLGEVYPPNETADAA